MATTTATARRPGEGADDRPERPRHVGAPHVAGPAFGDAGAERPETELVRHAPERQHDAAREALDLEPARELRADGEPRLAGREREKGEHDDRDRRRGDADDGRRSAPARPPERDDREQRQQEEGVELRGDREAEHERAESRAAGEKRCDRAGRQGDGQRIEARQDELAEEERRGGDEPEREGCMADRRAQRLQRDGGEDDRRGQEQCHQRREPARVPAGRVVQLGLVDRTCLPPARRATGSGRRGERPVGTRPGSRGTAPRRPSFDRRTTGRAARPRTTRRRPATTRRPRSRPGRQARRA